MLYAACWIWFEVLVDVSVFRRLVVLLRLSFLLDHAIVRDGPLNDEAIVLVTDLAIVAIVVILCVIELLRSEKPLPDLIGVEILDHFLVLLGELRIHLRLAETGKQVAVVWRLVHELVAKLLEADNLVEEKAGVQIPIAFPDWAWVDLAEYLAPLLDSHLLVLVQASLGQLVPLLDLKHVKDEFLIELLANVVRLRHRDVRAGTRGPFAWLVGMLRHVRGLLVPLRAAVLLILMRQVIQPLLVRVSASQLPLLYSQALVLGNLLEVRKPGTVGALDGARLGGNQLVELARPLLVPETFTILALDILEAVLEVRLLVLVAPALAPATRFVLIVAG